MSSRLPLTRWVRPTSKALENIYPSGCPPFYPFPTVTNLISARLCPRAIYHELLHGIDPVLTSHSQWQLQRSGTLFQDFIAFLKSMIAVGKFYITGIDDIRQEFITFSWNRDNRTREYCWEHYIEPWLYQKFEEILKIKQEAQLFFEINVSNSFVQFSRNGGTITYPLRGRIDEIDIDNQRIIERTIKGSPNDTEPPYLKDYEIWLLWKILSSTNSREYPETWKDIDFLDFDLVIETPYQDFQIEKNIPEFGKWANEGYAWIHDLTFDKRAEWETYQERNCTYENRNNQCDYIGLCYRRRPAYPTSRAEMRRAFRDIYRPLFWDQIWNWDYFQYQLVMLSSQKLENLRLISNGKILSVSDGKIEMEVPNDQAGPILALSERSNYMLLPFGTFFVGKRLEASFRSKRDNRLVMEIPRKEIPKSETVLILPLISDVSIFEIRPIFLSRNIQRDLHLLEYVGTNDPIRASKDSFIQLMESLFGRKNLRRERIDRSK